MNKFLAFALSVSSVSFDYAEGMKNPDISSFPETKNEASSISVEKLAPFFEGMNNDKIDALLNSAKAEVYAIYLMLFFGHGIEAMHGFIHKRGLTENGKLFWTS